MSEMVMATAEARDLIARLVARYGSLMFVQSGGCCHRSTPVCLPKGELLLGSNDLLIGEIDGCPFYIDREQFERWRQPQFLIDVSPGEGDSFSIEGPQGVHFVTRTRSKGETSS
ncbi:MAG TPA: DUF779 domain-containing protein [Ktedonobacteraceae bacterium]|nr:DUF779 domain-containing protein [Ktedonobacteraceae bacterium]